MNTTGVTNLMVKASVFMLRETAYEYWGASELVWEFSLVKVENRFLRHIRKQLPTALYSRRHCTSCCWWGNHKSYILQYVSPLHVGCLGQLAAVNEWSMSVFVGCSVLSLARLCCAVKVLSYWYLWEEGKEQEKDGMVGKEPD